MRAMTLDKEIGTPVPAARAARSFLLDNTRECSGVVERTNGIFTTAAGRLPGRKSPGSSMTVASSTYARTAYALAG